MVQGIRLEEAPTLVHFPLLRLPARGLDFLRRRILKRRRHPLRGTPSGAILTGQSLSVRGFLVRTRIRIREAVPFVARPTSGGGVVLVTTRHPPIGIGVVSLGGRGNRVKAKGANLGGLASTPVWTVYTR